MADPFDLERFVTAQAPVFETVLAELRAGQKRSHWMWFIFPQLPGLGRSSTARFYGISSVDDARTYLAHPVLGPRLDLCTRIVLAGENPSLHAIFGSPDDLKFRSCMTLFSLAPDDPDNPFRLALDLLLQRAARRTNPRACRRWEPAEFITTIRTDAGLNVCNDFGNNVPYSAYVEAFSPIRAPVVFPTAAPNLEPRDDIWPTETAPIFRRREHGVELAHLRWGFPPARPKGAPIINFRSEGRRFPKGRCLTPASHFFEFTGAKSPKSKWKFTRAGEDWFCFAGLWRPMPDGAGDAFTLLTTEPGPDVEPIHNRQMVVLDRADWLAWLDLTRPEAELLRPLPAGSLVVEQVR